MDIHHSGTPLTPMPRTMSRADVIRALAPVASITYRQLAVLTTTGLLTNQLTLDPDLTPADIAAMRPRYDPAEVDALLATCPHRELPTPYFRVSLTALRHNPIYDTTGQMIREYAGYDHHNTAGLTIAERRHAITATWPLGGAAADQIVDNHIPIVGAIIGFVFPNTCTYATDWVRAADKTIAFTPDTAPTAAAATNLGITTGVHIPITPGPIAHLVDHKGPPT